MDKQTYDYQEEVTEEDFDLFYGLVDSIFKDAKLHADQMGDDFEVSLSNTDPTEPFEEFLVGIPSQDVVECYALHTVENYAPNAVLSEPQKSNDSLVGGVLGLMLGVVLMLMTSYATSKARSDVPDMHEELVKLGGELSAVQANVKTVHSLEQYMKSVELKLGELTAILSAGAPVHAYAGSSDDNRRKKTLLNGGGELWAVNLISTQSSVKAAKVLDSLHSLGINAESIRVNINGKQWLRIRVTGFSSKKQAERAMVQLAKQTGFKSVWIGKEK